MAICKGCGKRILWIRSTGGRPIPCDPEPIPYKRGAGGRDRIVTPGGAVLAGTFMSDPDESDSYGYRSHWSTCSRADKFRAGRPQSLPHN